MRGPIAQRDNRPALGEITLAGFRMHPMSGGEVVQEIAEAVNQRRRLIMANINFHAMALMYDSRAMTTLLNQPDTLVMIDSMPLLFMANLAGHRLPRTKRTTSLEFYDSMFARGAREGWRFAYVGSRPEALTRGLKVLRERHPGLDITGQNGYFDLHDRSPGSRYRAIVDWLKAGSHDVVIVGMGMPRQEEWIAAIQHDVDARVFLPTGAYLDYQIGVQRLAPRWLGQIGLEWAFRLILSPRRLAYRYLVEPMVLAKRILCGRKPGGAPTKEAQQS